ncbi:MAG: ABC transporter substrate-binding protein [Candidatus Cloacimonadaceae bacterium]|nr:ABC transporter substrate-binding protein [Candidatus Cloacimonadaceae bacterium]MDP3114253.1 ABC transporter substrate-binding protein [Candidatus Cloacimonadaceae bacterium]
MNKILTVLLMALLLFSVSCKKKSDLRRVTVVLDWTPNTNHAGLYVALQHGYFRDAGLDVNIIQPGQNTADQIVASGNAQFGVSYQESVMLARAEDIPVISIAAIMQHNTSGFAALKSANIKRPKDFEGKRYGSSGWPSELAILETIMKDDSADFAKTKIISGVYDFFSTIGKDADFEWIYWGWDGVEAHRRNIEIDFIPIRGLNPIFDFYTPLIIANEKTVKAEPELVAAFLAAASKGYEYCIENPTAAADILIKQVPELNPEQVHLSMNYLSKEYRSDADKWGMQKLEVWQRFGDWMHEKALIPVPVKAEAAFTNKYLP